MSEPTVGILGRRTTGAELQTHTLGGKRKKAKIKSLRIKGIGTRTRSQFVSIKSRLRNTLNDHTHKTRYVFQESVLRQVKRKRRTGSQLFRESNGSNVECSETLIHSFSLLVADFVQFLNAQYVLFQKAQPRVRLSAPSGKDAYRGKKLERLQKLKTTFFATHSADFHLTETSFVHTVSFLLESILRPDPFTVDYTSIIDEALRKSAPVRVYLILIEKKLDVVRHVTSLPIKTKFEVLGLGDWGAVQALLARLFHLLAATASPAATSAENTEPTARSARRSVGSNHELKSKAAAEKSTDFATGIRILTVWCDYVRVVGKLMHQHRNQRILPSVQAVVDVVREMMAFSTRVRASESALAFDLGSVQMQRDIQNAAGTLDELVAELSALLIRYCSVDVSDIVPTSVRGALLPSFSRALGVDGLSQMNVEAQLRNIVPVLRALLTSWGVTRQTEATCRFIGAQLMSELHALETDLDHQGNRFAMSVQTATNNKQLASVVGSLLRKIKLQLVKMAPVASQRVALGSSVPDACTVPPSACTSSTSSTSTSSSTAFGTAPHTPAGQLPAVSDLIERVNGMLAKLPAEKSEIERLLRINDMTINASTV